jgi:hypothetical protein
MVGIIGAIYAERKELTAEWLDKNFDQGIPRFRVWNIGAVNIVVEFGEFFVAATTSNDELLFSIKFID